MAVRLSDLLANLSRVGPYGCETSMLRHLTDNRLTGGSEVASPMRWPLFTPRKIPGTCFR
jgi:hypothetical protein